MNSKLYVGNLPYDTTEHQLRDHFAPCGDVSEASIVSDRATGSPPGFGFVTMEAIEGKDAAIRDLDGQEFNGHALKVAVARPRENSSFGSANGKRW